MITYYLYTEGTLSPQRWMESLSRKGLVQEWSKRVNPMGVYSHLGKAEGLTLELQQVLQVNKFRQTVERLFQLNPSMKALFRVDESVTVKDGLAGRVAMLQIVSAILGMETGQALVLAKSHEIVLRRKEGPLLLLNTEINLWTPLHLSQIQLPYELRALPTPLRESGPDPKL